jgi:putative flavoprotein involved in K+ transport
MHATTVIIGAGHSGLAMSRRLTDRSIDHVVLERGDVANSWRTERWPSLRLLTPNWQTRLPGARYEGTDPDGFMSMPDLIDFMSAYAHAISAPVHTSTTVNTVRATDSGYEVVTNQGIWNCATVVLASGGCNLPVIPAVADCVPTSVTTLTSMDYRGPDQLADGGVLVVGGSATGVQLADEIQRSGRPVTLAVGEHVRMPRLYRGRDILWWMDAAGVLDERYDRVDDLTRARHVPSSQLIGTPERLTDRRQPSHRSRMAVVGRQAACGTESRSSRARSPTNARSPIWKMNRLLATVDEWATRVGLDGDVDSPHRFEPTHAPSSPTLAIDLNRGEIRTIIGHAATGHDLLGRPSGPRPQPTHPTRRRSRDRRAWRLSTRYEVPYAAGGQFHQRSRARHARTQRVPVSVPRREMRGDLWSRHGFGRAYANRPMRPTASRGREDGGPRSTRGAELEELRDFYERYIAAFNARDAAFTGFFHLPVTIFSLPSDDGRHDGRPPAVVTDVAKLWPTLPATWTRSTIDEIRVVADTTAFTPRDGFTEQRDRRPAAPGHGDQVGGDRTLRTGHVLYLLRVNGRPGSEPMVPLAVAIRPT